MISSGRAFGIFEGNRVLFKADLGSVSGSVCQVQESGWNLSCAARGWLLPATCGCRPVGRAHHHALTVSLYVNDYNLPARATYARVGFTQGWRVRDGPLLKSRTAWLAALGIELSVMVPGCTANEPAARTPAPPPPLAQPRRRTAQLVPASPAQPTQRACKAQADQRHGGDERRSAVAQHLVASSEGKTPGGGDTAAMTSHRCWPG